MHDGRRKGMDMAALGRSNLTLAQWTFWTAHRLYPDAPMYNAAHTFTVDADLDPDLFKRAFQALVDSHDALRTVFVESGGEPLRHVLPKLPVMLDRADLSAADDPDAALREWAQDRATRPFALDEPLFDAALVRLGPDRTAWYFNQHHLICDAWSSGLLVPRLAGFYADAVAGRLNGVAPFPRYDAFVEHERALRESDQGRQAEAYWQEALAEPPEAPTFYGRSNRALPARIARRTCDLGTDRTKALRQLAERDGVFHKSVNVTLSNIFFAALATFVSRVSGQRRLCIGQPYHNRDTDAFRETAGLFLAMLPVGVEVNADDTFVSLLGRVRNTIAEGLRHRPCFAQNRTDARLYDVVLNFYSAEFADFNGAPITQELLHPGWGLERLAVHVHDFTGTGRLQVYFDFDTAVFDEDLQGRAVAHFLNLIDAVLEDPARNLSECDILTDDERARLLGEWSGEEKPEPDHATIAAWIEARAAQRPEAVAVECGDQTVTYAQLNRRANQLARFLVDKGIGHESIVAVCFDPSPEWIVAVLALLKAGGAYLPLDPAYPDSRLAFMLSDSKASLVLASERHVPRFPDADVIDTAAASAEIDAYGTDNPAPVSGPNSLAYAIYTSGSTGEPKGVLIEHQGVCNTVQCLLDGYDIGEKSRLLQFATPGFDASVADIFCALASGGTLCLAPRERMMSPRDLASMIRDMAITVVTLPPAMLRLLDPEDGATVRTVVSAGERCPADLARAWTTGDGLRFVNGYGPTENTICTTMWTCSDRDDPVPIGRPIPNVRIYVLDETQRPVPQGAPGELCVGGPGLARGYLNRPELTAERFVPNPFAPSGTTRLYRTGDWVRFRNDGALVFLGRVDGQVKVRGFRIELGEIESVLRDAPGVKDAVAAVTEATDGEARLMAYIVPEDEPDVAELRARLRRSLPEYMIPSAFAVLDRVPTTASGKVDRSALPARGKARILDRHTDEGERTPVQQTVAEIWGHVLEVPPPGIHDNFFDLGGHSILSVHVIAQVKKRFGVDIPLPRFFAAPTVAGMADIIESTQAGEGTTDTDALPFTCVPIRPTGTRPPFFCVATAGGVLFPYFKLAPLMDKDQPLYGLQDPALDGKHPQIETVEELAAHYIEVMCMVEPRGPYMFGGYSFGGIVAFEMAQQLVRAGKDVALVVLMDNAVVPPEFTKPKGVVDAVRLFAKRLPFLIESTYNVKPHIVDGLYILAKRAQTRRDHAPGRHRASPLDYVRWLWTDLILSKAGVANVLSKDAVVAMRVPSFKPVMKLLNVNGHAGESYRPQPYPGKVTLFRASRRPPELQGDNTLGWDQIAAGGVDTRHISGDHMRMLGDSVAEVAEHLDDCVRKALGERELVAAERSGTAKGSVG